MSSRSSKGALGIALVLQATTRLGLPNLVGVLLPHRDDIEMVYLSLICAPYASYPWSFELMGSTSHLANEVENVNRDHSKTDGRIGDCRTLYV